MINVNEFGAAKIGNLNNTTIMLLDNTDPQKKVSYFSSLPSVTDKLVLNDDQRKAVNAISEWLESGSEPYFVLSGAGGTGKTTVVSALIEKYSADNDVYLTGTTHKCVEVLISRTPMQYYVEAMTIHKFLGLRPEPDAYGKLHLESALKRSFECNLAIVDEASMIGAGIWEWLDVEASPYIDTPGFSDIKWLFIGDSGQINPVNEAESIVFEKDLPGYCLSKVVRYGGDLLNFAAKIRANGTSVISEWGKKYNSFSLFREEFLQDAFINPPGDCVYLAWTNQAVEAMREEVRLHLYDATDVIPFVPGEILRANSDVYTSVYQEDCWGFINRKKPLPIPKNFCLVGRNSNIFKVLSAEEVAPDKFPYWTYRLRLENSSLLDRGISYAIHPISVPHLSKDLELISGLAVEWKQAHKKKNELEMEVVRRKLLDLGFKGVGGGIVKSAWEYYYSLRRLFPSFSSPYVLTVHKSQGSDYQSVWINCPDILRNKNALERDRLLYTAVTRSRKNLSLYMTK